MKTVYLFLTLAFLTACSSNEVEIGNKTTMEVEKLFDAGRVVKGEVVHAKFKVTNTGDFPLVIGEVKVGCSCTLASKPEDPIAPGSTGIIEASVDTEKIGTGVFNKSISIIANTVPSTTEVVIQGNVVE